MLKHTDITSPEETQYDNGRVALSLKVEIGGVKVDASAVRLFASDLVLIQANWITDLPNEANPTQAIREAVAGWEWHKMARGTTRVYGLSVNGYAGFQGLIAFDVDGETALKKRCFAFDYVASSPASRQLGMKGVATSLIAFMVEQSLVHPAALGRIRISQAVGQSLVNQKDCPACLYTKLGFKPKLRVRYDDVLSAGHGVEYDWYEIMELTIRNAVKLVNAYRRKNR